VAKDHHKNLLQMDYADRQLIVVRPDDEVVRARQAAALPGQVTPESSPDHSSGTPGVIGATLSLGLAVLSSVSRWWTSRTERRDLFIFPITRTEARQLKFPVGHPLPDVVYVGNPAMPSAYYTLADFHRQTFGHKVGEAMTLLGALGADTISVTAVQGWSKEYAGDLQAWLRLTPIKGEAHVESKTSGGRGYLYEARLGGSGDPRIPKDLTWFPHEPEWQGFARNRIDNDLREFTLHVRYEEDFSIDAELAAKVTRLGLKAGGSFHRHESTVWAIHATFPPVQNRVLRAIKHPFS
jgi:hypothetical protein